MTDNAGPEQQRETLPDEPVSGAVSASDETLPVAVRSSSWLRKTLWGLSGLLVLVVLLVGLVLVRLSIAPVSVSGFLNQIEALAEGALPEGQSLEIEDALVSFADQGGLALRLSGISLKDPDKTLLSAPRIDLVVGLLDLISSKLRPTEIYIPEMMAHVRRDENGRILIAGQDPGADEEVFGPPVRSQAIFYDPDEPEFVSLAYSMRRAIKPLTDPDLTKRPPRILIRNTEIALEDEIEGSSRSFHNVALSYNPTGAEDDLWRIDFAADGHNGRIAFAMAEYPLEEDQKGEEGRSIELRFADLSLADLAPRFADKSQNFQFAASLYGAARFDFDLKGELVDMRTALDVGAGQLEFDAEDSTYLDEASFRLDWDPGIRAMKLERGKVLFGETGGEFRGVAVWPETQDGDIRIALEGADIKLAARDNPNPAKFLKQLILNMKVGRESGVSTIERFAAIADEGNVQGSGSMAWVNGELTATMTFVASAMPYDLLGAIWPVPIANGARQWIIENIGAGQMTGGTIELSLTESMLERNEDNRLILPDEAVLVRFGAKDLRIKGFGDLPPAEKVDGSGVITGRTFVASIDEGYFLTKAGRRFPINSGLIEIPDHSEKPPIGVVVVDGEGDAAALGEIADSDPLNVLAQEKHKPGDLSGRAHARVKVRFPFLKDLKKEEVDYSAKIELKDFASAASIRGYKLNDATLSINTDGSRIAIVGNGLVDGLKTDLDLVTSTDDSVAFSSKFALKLDDDDRRKMGFDLSDWLRGPIFVKARQDGNEEGVTHFEVDLTKAVIALDEIGWRKKANVRGTAIFALADKGGLLSVRDAKLTGDGFDAVGSAEIDKQSGLQKLTVANLRLSRGDRLRLDVVQSQPDFYTVRLTGDLLDLRGKFLSGSIGAPTQKGAAPTGSYRINMAVKRIIGLSGHTLSDFTASILTMKGKDKSIKAKGLIDGRSQLSVDTKQDKHPTVQISSGDAGALLRFTGALDRVLGGRLAMSVALQDGWDKVSGSVLMKDFNLSGRVQQQREQSGSGQQVSNDFAKLTLQFSGQDGIYRIRDGVLKSASLGATMGGSLNLKEKTLSLGGTYIPAYGLNNIFSRVPVLGRIIGGRKNEGLIGITFKVKGSLSNPEVFINPASVLAPGVFRQIFEFNR
ncbi:hypothetical protein FDK21_04775 [Cohaesibacter sp. CAU 1516]|uniref:AsmA-like C-terminal domain-containing protein n=1 Tax=Cohaesibacter sp. CAU 1516 TaxID=2576038 RepID=UPI0010FF3944|nr:AsmA-like C-terminal domain-containing protein [Cohaesibacter sp. CAU 1516]TLP48964.1 hypothetical protein FDK21_04775 [Cohaesibacter sp. CAU 1516]